MYTHNLIISCPLPMFSCLKVILPLSKDVLLARNSMIIRVTMAIVITKPPHRMMLIVNQNLSSSFDRPVQVPVSVCDVVKKYYV